MTNHHHTVELSVGAFSRTTSTPLRAMASSVFSYASSISGSTSLRYVRQAMTRRGMRGTRSMLPFGNERKSPAAGPCVTEASSRTSATLVPLVPCVENSIQRGSTLRPMAPIDGLYPTSPHAEAGPRTLPPPSDVVARGTRPAASAAALPPLEPPLDFSGFHGLRVAPNTLFTVVAVAPNSGELVRPMRIAPASSSLCTTASDTSSAGPSA